jgi:hypothetical protein
MVYRRLAAYGRKRMSAEYVSQFLENLDIIASDLTPSRRDVRRGLLISAWAARKGPHGEAIRAFFKGHDWVFDHYDISRDMEVPPEGGMRNRLSQTRWFEDVLDEKVASAAEF